LSGLPLSSRLPEKPPDEERGPSGEELPGADGVPGVVAVEAAEPALARTDGVEE
jgi:hypothetical protein